jgi:hypothetical protein
MAHYIDDDRFDDDDDIANTRKGKGGFPVWAIMLLCALPLVAVALLVAGGAALFWARQSPTRQADAQPQLVEDRMSVADRQRLANQPAKRMYTRDELNALVVGATPDDVRAALGEPDHTHVVAGKAREHWIYLDKVRDGPAGLPLAATVNFERGLVVSVHY